MKTTWVIRGMLETLTFSNLQRNIRFKLLYKVVLFWVSRLCFSIPVSQWPCLREGILCGLCALHSQLVHSYRGWELATVSPAIWSRMCSCVDLVEPTCVCDKQARQLAKVLSSLLICVWMRLWDRVRSLCAHLFYVCTRMCASVCVLLCSLLERPLCFNACLDWFRRSSASLLSRQACFSHISNGYRESCSLTCASLKR